MGHFKFSPFFSAIAKNISLTHFINLFFIISVHKSSIDRHQKSNRAPRRHMVQWEGQAGNSQLPQNVERTNRGISGTEEASWSFPSSSHPPQESSLLGLEPAEECSSALAPWFSWFPDHHQRALSVLSARHYPYCGNENCGIVIHGKMFWMRP